MPNMCSHNTCNVGVHKADRAKLVFVVILYSTCVQPINCNDLENNIFLAPFACENHTTSCSHQVS